MHIQEPHCNHQNSYCRGNLEQFANNKHCSVCAPTGQRHTQDKQEIGQDICRASDQGRFRALRAYQPCRDSGHHCYQTRLQKYDFYQLRPLNDRRRHAFSAADALLCLMLFGATNEAARCTKKPRECKRNADRSQTWRNEVPAKFNYIRITYGLRSFLFGRP